MCRPAGRYRATAIALRRRPVIANAPATMPASGEAARVTSASNSRGTQSATTRSGISIVQFRRRFRRYVATSVHVSTVKTPLFGARYPVYSRR